MITFLFIQTDNGVGIPWHVLRSFLQPHAAVVSMRLSGSASVFIVETWTIIKALEEIKNALSSK